MTRGKHSWLLSGIALAAGLAIACGGGSATRKKRDPETDAASKYRLAQVILGNGRILDALAEIDAAVALAPANPDYHSFRGQVLFLAGRYPPAEAAYRRALEIDPYKTDVHNNLGALYDRMGRPADAEEEYRTALADPAYPTPEKVRLNLGILYGAQGRNEEAIRELRRAVEIAPKFYGAHYELATRLEAVGKLDEAAREFEVAAPEYRNSGEYHYRLGLTYFRLGDKAKASEHLKRVQELAPGSENSAKADDLLRLVR